MTWYEEWFDSPYYPILYKNRGTEEATRFVDNLHQKLQLPPTAKVLDLACGGGRFAYPLSLHYPQTFGMDISPNSLQNAKKHYGKSVIQFIQQDMLHPFAEQNFDAIFNFFTSFGYFGITEMQNVLRHIYHALSPQGILLIDYLNTPKNIPLLPSSSSLEKEGIHFSISKKIEHHYIVKRIAIHDPKNHVEKTYTEKVHILSLLEFSTLLCGAHFEVQDVFGDYELSPFVEDKSERMILLAKKG